MSRLPAVAVLLTLGPACSVRKYAINMIGNSLAKGGTTFASDEDPELVGDALPFSLKLMESLLAESPRHRGLLLAAASGFTQYAFVYVEQPADEAEDQDLAKATAMRHRARQLYLRARDYALRGLETAHAGFEQKLRSDPHPAVRIARKGDVPLLYWTAAAWGAAISLSKDEPKLIADLSIVESLIDRALELDEAFDAGSIHNLLITYELSRPSGTGDPAARARVHFERAVKLSKGQLASPLVNFAEAVSVSKQNRAEFQSLLNRALEIDVNARPEWRLANLVMQRRARWLLQRADQLFVE